MLSRFSSAVGNSPRFWQTCLFTIFPKLWTTNRGWNIWENREKAGLSKTGRVADGCFVCMFPSSRRTCVFTARLSTDARVYTPSSPPGGCSYNKFAIILSLNVYVKVFFFAIFFVMTFQRTFCTTSRSCVGIQRHFIYYLFFYNFTHPKRRFWKDWQKMKSGFRRKFGRLTISATCNYKNLCSPNEDLGRRNTRRNATFRSTFQGRENSIWATNHWKVHSKSRLSSFVPPSKIFAWEHKSRISFCGNINASKICTFSNQHGTIALPKLLVPCSSTCEQHLVISTDTSACYHCYLLFVVSPIYGPSATGVIENTLCM